MSADPRRRALLTIAAALPFAGVARLARAAAAPGVRKLLVLVELKGGNDGLNTVVPYADPNYAKLRPRLALDRDQLVKLTPEVGLHPSLEKLAPIWESKRLAIVQGLGYPEIAAALGCTYDDVKMNLSLARKRLKEELKGYL